MLKFSEGVNGERQSRNIVFAGEAGEDSAGGKKSG
jgi:hypothetical protein